MSSATEEVAAKNTLRWGNTGALTSLLLPTRESGASGRDPKRLLSVPEPLAISKWVACPWLREGRTNLWNHRKDPLIARREIRRRGSAGCPRQGIPPGHPESALNFPPRTEAWDDPVFRSVPSTPSSCRALETPLRGEAEADDGGVEVPTPHGAHFTVGEDPAVSSNRPETGISIGTHNAIAGAVTTTLLGGEDEEPVSASPK